METIQQLLSTNTLKDSALLKSLTDSPFIKPLTIAAGCVIGGGIVGGLYIAYKCHTGYYRSDISVEQAFNREDYELFGENKNVIVLGCSSSGKSTLSKQLAKKLPLRHVELDYQYWLPGWNHRSDEEFQTTVRRILDENKQDGWIVDGDYPEVRHMLWSDVQLVIWLDYEFWVVFWRAIKRTTWRIVTGEEICNGNTDTLWSTLSGIPVFGGIPGWVWQEHPKFKERIAEWTVQYPHVKILIIPSPNHCNHWFKNLKH